jgi:glycosyltransferase involved in cell wall biosynthesis
LTSLNAQQDVDVEVFVNDDGSTDGTIEILETWRAKGLIVSISQSRGLGATRAFLTLLQSCEEKEFVAFCDQDDIWVRNKLTSQVNSLQGTIPMITTCLRLHIDESGRVIGSSKDLRTPPSFLNAMFENIAPGNTVLLNNSAVKLINSLKNPPINHYDSWIYLLISCFGKVNITSSHLVMYRLHQKNSVGLRKKSFRLSRKAISNYLNQQSFLLGEQYEILPEENRERLIRISSFVKEKNFAKRILLIKNIQIGRQSNLDEVIFKFLILLVK